jgi:hypothetical protein
MAAESGAYFTCHSNESKHKPWRAEAHARMRLHCSCSKSAEPRPMRANYLLRCYIMGHTTWIIVHCTNTTTNRLRFFLSALMKLADFRKCPPSSWSNNVSPWCSQSSNQIESITSRSRPRVCIPGSPLNLPANFSAAPKAPQPFTSTCANTAPQYQQ